MPEGPNGQFWDGAALAQWEFEREVDAEFQRLWTPTSSVSGTWQQARENVVARRTTQPSAASEARPVRS